MSEYFATVSWNRKADESFIDNKYSRGHNWQFDGGVVGSCLFIAAYCSATLFRRG